MASKFISDIAASDYKLLCKGPHLEEITVEDLKPAQWYHFRVTIEYAGTCVISESRAYATLCSAPDKPKQPYVYLIMNENDMFTSRTRSQPQVRLTWGPPASNGSQIVKYHVQIQEYFQQSPTRKGLSTSSLQSSPYQKACRLSTPAGESLLPEKWKTVYCNLVQTVLLDTPRSGCQAWGIRLRALNASGWSEYSDPLVLDYRSHPNLFETLQSLGVSKPAASKLPPLCKTTTPKKTQRRSFDSDQNGSFHEGNVDIWSSSPLDVAQLQRASSLEEGPGSGGASHDDWSKTPSSLSRRAQTAPSVTYDPPRCKTPSMLLPPNHPDSIRIGTANAVDGALLSSRQHPPVDRGGESRDSVTIELLDREIDR